MKRMRKGFTLVELLIVIAILGALSATMTASVTGATAKAKAAAIASNVDSMKSAAQAYYAAHMEDASSTGLAVKTSVVLDAYIATWRDFAKDGSAIKYTPDASATGYEGWAVEVDFSGDADAANINSALGAIKGYGSYPDEDNGNDINRLDGNKFKVYLFSGKIAQVTTTPLANP